MEKVQGSNTSVYVGNLIQEYTAMFAYDTEVNPQYAGTGNSFAMLSNRISFTYDLQGSSVSVDSACSSGLVGLELASESLLRGDSEMVNLPALALSFCAHNLCTGSFELC